MREIKFRAWHMGERKLYYSKQNWIKYNIGGKDSYIFNLVSFEFKENDLKVVDYEDDGCPITESQIEIMQYTGLKDKNGKEIYEGDILRNAMNAMNAMGVEVVKYGYQSCDCCHGVYGFATDCCTTKLKDSEDIEVMGNIYENPELIKN